MFEEFSNGYLIGRLFVQPHSGERPVLHSEEHKSVSRSIKGDNDTDEPLIMKLDHCHLPVWGENGVPSRTLAVPESIIEKIDMKNPPSLKEVLLVKPRFAERFFDVQ